MEREREQELQARVAELTADNARLRRLLDVGVGVWAIDAHARTTFANARMADMLGCTREEMAQSSMFDFVAPAAVPQSMANLERRKSGIRDVHDFVFRRKDGSELRAIMVATPLHDEQGAFAGAIGHVIELAELADSRRSLPPTGLELVRLCDAAPIGVVLSDLATGRILAVNRRAAEMLGRTREEMIGHTSVELGMWLSPEDRLRTAAQVAHDGVAHGVELVSRRADGNTVETLATIVSLREGGATHALTFAQDMTALKRAEAELRASQARFAALFQLNPVGTSVTRLSDGRIVDVNDAFCALLETTRDEVLGRTTTELALWDEDQRASMVAELAKSGRVAAQQATLRTRRGHTRHVVVAAAVIEHEGERYIVAPVLDVTEQKDLEEKLRLADRVATAGTMAAGVAHEINNPLTWIIANVDYALAALEDCHDQKPARDALAEARAGIERIAKIVREVRTLAYGPSDEAKPVDLNGAVRTAANMARSELRHRARLELDLGELPQIVASEAKLVQVFLNLLVNAAHAIPEGSASDNRVTVRTRVEGERVVAEVEDTGAGIPEPLRDRVFEPFFTTKPAGAGTGLGLPIVRSIVAGYGGSIELESETGRGTTFRLRLPAMRAQPTAPATTPAATVGGRLRVLVVDDEPAVLAAFKRVLRRHDVTTESDASAALARIAAGERFDAILCDVMMPNVDGIELAERIAEVSPSQAAAIVFVTGGVFAPKLAEALARWPNPVIEKPLAAATLEQTLAQAAARR